MTPSATCRRRSSPVSAKAKIHWGSCLPEAVSPSPFKCLLSPRKEFALSLLRSSPWWKTRCRTSANAVSKPLPYIPAWRGRKFSLHLKTASSVITNSFIFLRNVWTRTYSAPNCGQWKSLWLRLTKVTVSHNGDMTSAPLTWKLPRYGRCYREFRYWHWPPPPLRKWWKIFKPAWISVKRMFSAWVSSGKTWRIWYGKQITRLKNCCISYERYRAAPLSMSATDDGPKKSPNYW